MKIEKKALRSVALFALKSKFTLGWDSNPQPPAFKAVALYLLSYRVKHAHTHTEEGRKNWSLKEREGKTVAQRRQDRSRCYRRERKIE